MFSWVAFNSWISVLSITPEPYDVKLLLTLLSRFNSSKGNWSKHSIYPNTWTKFTISKMADSIKQRPTSCKAILLCITRNLMPHFDTAVLDMSVTWKLIRYWRRESIVNTITETWNRNTVLSSNQYYTKLIWMLLRRRIYGQQKWNDDLGSSPGQKDNDYHLCLHYPTRKKLSSATASLLTKREKRGHLVALQQSQQTFVHI